MPLIMGMNSGSSFDGIDVVLAETKIADDGFPCPPVFISGSSYSWPKEVEEIILALNATIDGQTTAYFITDQLKDCNVKVSRLAHGVPVGGELDYMDDGTLQTALQSRQPF